MNCIIIEDEPHVAKHLLYLLGDNNFDCIVLATLTSISESVLWLKNNKVDLIFMDIQLSDGISFEIFNQIELNVPIIFTTSYDSYAVEAFKRFGIAYLLKPIDIEELKTALDKYKIWFENKSINESIKSIASSYQSRFMVNSGNQIHTVLAKEIAIVYVKFKQVFFTSLEGTTYAFDGSLDNIEKRLNPQYFFRINRQFIINFNAIEKMYNETRGRVKIVTTLNFNEDLVVSIDRAVEFKKWLNR